MVPKKGFLLAMVAVASLGWSQAQTTPPKSDPQTKPGDVMSQPTELDKAPDQAAQTKIEAVTFSETPGAVYVPLRELAEMVGWELAYDEASETTTLNTHAVSDKSMRTLWSGTTLVDISALKEMGAEVIQQDGKNYAIKVDERPYQVVIPDKFVEVSVSRQLMRAWQGSRLVLKTKVSTGMSGHATPMGKFKTGPVKVPMKYSSLYESAPMPWSVQVVGDIFTHGSNSVPGYPASHGCVRMPLTGKNAARFFYRWVDLNVRYNIVSDWTDEAKELIAMEEQGQEELATEGKIKPPTGVGKPPRRKPVDAKRTVRKPVVLAKPDPTKFVGPGLPGKG
jgi:lipoprotein-anchoring transpeptidase ErfK/SrfK